MNIIGNLLALVNLFDPSDVVDLNFIGKYIRILIEWTGNVGVGIILFTLTLKLISLPFDIFSKVNMKKNAVKMEMMRPQLEKLQKQYANDKNLYNQKMMALYKQNGYSMFGACLPTILMLVLFFVAIRAFNVYSCYSVINEFNQMIVAYNDKVIEVVGNEDLFDQSSGVYTLNEEKFFNGKLGEYKPEIKALIGDDYANLTLDLTKTETITAIITENADFAMFFVANEDGTYSLASGAESAVIAKELISYYGNSYLLAEVKVPARQAAADAYKVSVNKFLWVKNIWRPDVSYVSPFPENIKTWQSLLSRSASCGKKAIEANVTEAMFEEITANIVTEKEEANGYYILVVLSVLSIFLSTFITQKMQKAQQELQTVDGQGAATQKMMMWITPVMFGFFAFQYSAAFSIYMVVSTVVSTLTSLLINFLVQLSFKNKLESEPVQQRSVKKVIVKDSQESESPKKGRKK